MLACGCHAAPTAGWIGKGADFGELSLAHQMVSHLLAVTTGAKKCPIDGTGKTPLHTAARYGHNEVLRRLVEHYGPEHIDALDHKGRSVLWFALANNHVRCVEVLLKHGAKLQLVDARGEDAEEIASRCHLKLDEWEHHRLRTLLDSRYGLPLVS